MQHLFPRVILSLMASLISLTHETMILKKKKSRLFHIILFLNAEQKTALIQ